MPRTNTSLLQTELNYGPKKIYNLGPWSFNKPTRFAETPGYEWPPSSGRSDHYKTFYGCKLRIFLLSYRLSLTGLSNTQREGKALIATIEIGLEHPPLVPHLNMQKKLLIMGPNNTKNSIRVIFLSVYLLCFKTKSGALKQLPF